MRTQNCQFSETGPFYISNILGGCARYSSCISICYYSSFHDTYINIGMCNASDA
jgi:hypothetical protein